MIPVYAPAAKADLVTVIVPCYNGAAFLAAALTSAFEQTHTAMEVVVVDDGSTDASPDIARRFPVRYVRQENGGLSAARNTGIRVSTGDYLVFLDADDRLLPEAVESGLRTLRVHPECAMAVGDHVFISQDGLRLRKSQKNGAVRSPYAALLKSNFIEMISSVLFRRSIFDQVGTFSTTLHVAEDYDLYLRIARKQPICFHSAIVAEYRLHNTSLSRNSELMLTTTLQVLQKQKEFVNGNAEMRLAFRHGIRSWQRQYGRKLASELAGPDSLVRLENVKRKLWTLATSYPQGLLLLLLLRLRPAALGRGFRAKPCPMAADPRPSST